MITELEEEIEAMRQADIQMFKWKQEYEFASPKRKKEMFENMLKMVGLKPEDVLLKK